MNDKVRAIREHVKEATGSYMLLEYEATWPCELGSDTWYDCPTETSEDPEYADVEWCRSCKARAVVLEGARHE